MKFSIVTPAYNMERWATETIESVLSQEGDFEIEYIVVDDGSSDGTANLARRYEARVKDGMYQVRCRKITMEVISQTNTGMYEAINRGFLRATGDVFAWINADDLYESGAFAKIAAVLRRYPDIQWVKGIVTQIDENGSVVRRGVPNVYRQDWLALGIYGMEAYFVEQDSVFWRRSLWEKVRPMPSWYRSAADYWLWIQMAKHAKLWFVREPVSRFRKRQGQISKGVATYKAEQREARPRRPLRAWAPRLFFNLYYRTGKPGRALLPHLYPFLFSGPDGEAYLEPQGDSYEIRFTRSFLA